MAIQEIDSNYMQIAVELAKAGVGFVSPNPPVGAVIVKNNRIIGRGAHLRYGGNHAEINAIGDTAVEDATLYVTLEPCNHYGNTPPCVERILKEKINRVVIGSVDPDPRMKGKSITALKACGLEVTVGVLKGATDELFRFYANWKKTGFPFVTIKLAVTKDGFIAGPDGESNWISGSNSRVEVHKMRAEYDAVLVGTTTIVTDDPALTVRHVPGRNPNRVVLDRLGRLDAGKKVFADNTSRIFYFSSVSRNDLPERVFQIRLKDADFNPSMIFKILSEQGQQSVLVEGGANIATAFLTMNLCNEIIIYRGQQIFGGGTGFDESILPRYGFQVLDREQSGSDTKTTYRESNV